MARKKKKKKQQGTYSSLTAKELEDMTIGEGRPLFMKEIEDGESVICGLCGRVARQQDYAFGYNEARALMALVAAVGHWMNESGYAPWKNFYHIRNGLMQLANWKVAEVNPESQGFWRPTPLGIDFAYNRVCIPKRAIKYNKELLQLKGEQITIKPIFPNVDDYLWGVRCMNQKRPLRDWVKHVHNLKDF
jgi:hypothetical protein